MNSAARLTASRRRWGLAFCAALALACALLALLVGSVEIDLGAVMAGVGPDDTIFWKLRLPRVALAAMVGAGLAASGAALQPALRNPLASPDIIGVSGGAALAAVLALAWMPAWASTAGVPLLAFVGAGAAAAFVYRASLVNGRLDPYTQILVGVVFNTFCASLILLVNALADASRTRSIVFWMMGGVSVQPWPALALAGSLFAVGIVMLMGQARSLNLSGLGDDTAASLGFDASRCRATVFAASALVVGASVALTGVITFVGLVVPHLMRRLLGSDNRLLLPASVLGGAAFLVASDTIARWALAPVELPVGAITAMTGGPFFLYLLRRHGRVRAEDGP